MKTYHIAMLVAVFFFLPFVKAGGSERLSLPRQEQLSSRRVTQVIQDSEGFLWYATEGGGVCRDDGRRISVFRSDAEHPRLLCSNDVASLAEAAGRYIIIGTYHGANVLDKRDYSIRRLEEVDDKRVDDIVVGRNGHWWLTANKKLYEYSAQGQLLNVYAGGDKYIFRLHEDRQQRLWGTEWGGGLLVLAGGAGAARRLKPMPWPLDVAPTTIADDPAAVERLLIGTFGRGMVSYHPESGTAEPTGPGDSICMSHVSSDLQGRLLVADGLGHCYVLAQNGQQAWRQGHPLTRYVADSVRAACQLTDRPTALAEHGAGELWFSTGRDIRRLKAGKEDIVLPDTKDVAAMAFTGDGTLWLATIFGTLMSFRDGQLTVDDYGSNEHGDAVVTLLADSAGGLVIGSQRYVRRYDPARQTLCQQSIEDGGVYRVELQETQPGCRWSQPQDDAATRMPAWAVWLLAAALGSLTVLGLRLWLLNRQRKQAPAETSAATAAPLVTTSDTHDAISTSDTAVTSDEDETPWLQQATAHVEAHLSDDAYSVEQLASDLCMSRMTLYRKIQAATGQKPTEFIRTIRLQRAAELLRQNRMTVTEVSYATGFSSVSYFSRCFRAMFGVAPTNFSKTS